MATLTEFTTNDNAALEKELSLYSDFGLAMEELIENLRLARGEHADVALILKKILRKESSKLDLGQAVEEFGRSVLDESYFNLISQEILSSLANRIKCANLLFEMLKTYLNRKCSLIQYQHEYSSGEYGNSLFNLKILHDRVQAGVRCFEISCDAIVTGRPLEAAWITVEAHNGRNFIPVTSEYLSWGAESFRAKIAAADQQTDRPRFSAIFPISLRQQIELATDVKILIPYAALDKGEDTSRISLHLCLKDKAGKKLASRWLEDFSALNWPRQSGLALPSPQSLDLWPEDPRSGSRFLGLEVVELTGTEAVLKSRFEVIGDKGRDFFIKYRALNAQGENLTGGDLASSKISFSANYSLLQHLQRISWHGLALEADNSKDPIIEAALYDSMNRKLCGALIRLVPR